MCEASPVEICQRMKPESNRYRLECGYYFDCGCLHAVGSLAYCVQHGIDERVTHSAVIVNGEPIISGIEST